MNKSELQKAMAEAGVRPNRKLGQNFLIDGNFLDWIAGESGAAPGVKIIEVGPGFGALTERLLARGADVTAVEYDLRIAEWLRAHLCPNGLKLVEGDACKVDFTSIHPSGTEWKLVSNLPYSAGTVIVANFLEKELPPSEMLIMLQKEVAQRLAAKSGDEEYGALSVRAAASYDSELLKLARPELFSPRPEVDSCVLRMRRKADLPSMEFRIKLSRLVRIAFAQRRKKMLRQLSCVYGAEPVSKAAEKAGIDPAARPEHVTAEQFFILCRELPSLS